MISEAFPMTQTHQKGQRLGVGWQEGIVRLWRSFVETLIILASGWECQSPQTTQSHAASADVHLQGLPAGWTTG